MDMCAATQNTHNKISLHIVRFNIIELGFECAADKYVTTVCSSVVQLSHTRGSHLPACPAMYSTDI